MVLTVEQIREALKNRKKQGVIAKAIRHENRLRFHTESFMEPSDISQAVTDFLDWVKTLIPADKYRIFLSLFKFPSPIVQLTNSIYSELERVFDSKNPNTSAQFTDTFYANDWDYYRTEELKESTFWRTKAWDRVKTAINSIVVVDLPVEQNSSYPEPYFYFLDIHNVIDYGYSDGEITYLIFKQKGNKIAVFDDKSYRVFELNKEGLIVGEPLEAEHDLGYCPAKFFWNTPLSSKNPDLKKAPISPQLANLDWLLFFGISKRVLDLYAPYPIYSGYAYDCDFIDSDNEDYCDGGFLRNKEDMYKVLSDRSLEPCPVCAAKRLVGAGGYFEVPVPTKDEPDLRNPISITTVDKGSLEYNVEEVERLENSVYAAVVGASSEVTDKQSVNEKQIVATSESKTNILRSLKVNLEGAKKFVLDTVCRLRYGDNFISSTVSFGTEFYVYTLSDLYLLYETAKKNGASEATLDVIYTQIIETEYRNNPIQLQRMLILKHLEPYRHFSLDEILKLDDKGLLNKDLLLIKINFNSFVDRFERENTNIIEFGSQLEFDKKVEIITEKFKEYGKEQSPGSGTSE